MTTTELLGQAVWVMLFGMAIVFCFLTLLIWAVKLSKKIIDIFKLNKNEPAKPTAPAAARKKEVPVAAITAAINNYRQEK